MAAPVETLPVDLDPQALGTLPTRDFWYPPVEMYFDDIFDTHIRLPDHDDDDFRLQLWVHPDRIHRYNQQQRLPRPGETVAKTARRLAALDHIRAHVIGSVPELGHLQSAVRNSLEISHCFAADDPLFIATEGLRASATDRISRLVEAEVEALDVSIAEAAEELWVKVRPHPRVRGRNSRFAKLLGFYKQDVWLPPRNKDDNHESVVIVSPGVIVAGKRGTPARLSSRQYATNLYIPQDYD